MWALRPMEFLQKPRTGELKFEGSSVLRMQFAKLQL